MRAATRPPAVAWVLIGLVTAATAVGGCGSARRVTSASTASTTPAEPARNGALLFATSCSSCHTLALGDRRRVQGGNLVGYRMTAAQLLSFARVMPVPRPLSEAELRAVVGFVLSAQRRAAAGRTGG